MERKVDLGRLDLGRMEQPGYPGVEEKAARQLASAFHRSASLDSAISWSAQEYAQTYANTHELSEVLDEIRRLEKIAHQRFRASFDVLSKDALLSLVQSTRDILWPEGNIDQEEWDSDVVDRVSIEFWRASRA